MSRKHKNNHYHYAEKYSDRSHHERMSVFAKTPLLFMILVLLGFGCISTTFSVFVSTQDTPQLAQKLGMQVAVRNKQVNNPMADSYAVAPEASDRIVEPTEEILPEPTVVKSVSVGKKADLADTGAQSDLADTGAEMEITSIGDTTWHGDWRDTGSNSTATIYYDNSITQWTSVKFKIGRNWNYGGDAKGYSIIDMTKVNGTDDIYKIDNVNWGKYTDFYFVNGGTAGWYTNSVRDHDEKYTAFTNPMSFDLGSGTYFFIGQSSSTGTTASPTEINIEGAGGNGGVTTSSDFTTYQKSVSVSAVDHGVLSVSYTKDDNTTATISEGDSETLLIGKKLTVSMTPDTGYAVTEGVATVTYAGNSSSVSVADGGTTFTSGSTDTTVSCSFYKALPDVCDSVTLTQTSPASGTTIYSGDATSVTYTAAVTNPVSGTLTYKLYVDNVETDSNTTGVFNISYKNADTYSLYVEVSKSAHTPVESNTLSTTVTALPTVSFKYNVTEAATANMTYDAAASAVKSNHLVYKLERTWKGGTSQYNILINDGSNRFMTSSPTSITDSLPLAADPDVGFPTQTSGDKWIVFKTTNDFSSSTTGKFTFYWDYNTKKLYAEYPHKVSYNMQNHGTQVSDEIVPYNGKVTQPSAPSADGYDFGGWYEEAGCSNAWNFSTGTIIANKTLYAKWTPKAYTITLDRQSGSGGTASTSATYGSALTAITVPTRAGYDFGGYFTGTNGSGTKYYDDEGVGVKSWDIADNTTLYAKWTIINYTITLHTDSGSYVGTAWTNDQAAFTVESSTIALPDLEKTGYTFQGWYEDSSHTGTAVTEVAAGSTGNREYYAYFTLNSYTVTLIQSYPDADTHAEIKSAWYTGLSNVSANQSQTVDGSANCVTTFEYNVNSSAITLPAVISNENLGDFSAAPVVGNDSYLFAGWYTTANPAAGTTPVTTIAAGSTGDKTYYAKWTEPIAVHFVNDVTGQDITRYVPWGGSVADANVPSFSAIPGFTFNTWYSQSSAQNNYNAKNNVTAEQYIYAKYTMTNPQFNATLTAKDPDTHQADPGEHVGSGTGLSSANPYMVNYGAELTADASVATTYTVTDTYSNSAGVWYSWSVDNENYTTPDKTSTGLTYTQTLPTTKTIASSSPESIGFNLKVRFYSHSAQDYVEKTARVSLYYQYYGVESPIRTMELGLPQRIYQSSDSVSAPVTDLVATISSRVPASYVVALRKFSNSALSYNAEDSLVTRVLATKGAGGNFTVNQSPADTMSHTFNNLEFNTYFNSNGVKSFTYGVEYPDESDPPVYTQDSELEVPIKNITVGTNSYVANHPVFLKFTGGTEPTGRIMMYYIQKGEVICQTGARIRANLYRFSLPDAVTNVYFADAAIEDDNDEVLEYVKADPSDFSDYQGYFKAWSVVQNIPVGTQTLTADLNESTHTIDNFVNSAL